MAKFYGNIGYGQSVLSKPGVWEDRVIVRPYYGELTRNARTLQESGQINDDINIANEISIVSDPFANENFHAMRYVEYMGTKWKISKVEVRYPRLILTIGGLYNGQTP